MNKITLFILVISLIFATIPLASAAQIHGIIYDYDLNKANGAIIKVNTVPTQQYVSIGGDYSFSLSKGHYEMIVEFENDAQSYYNNQSLEINSDGDYVIDIILIPDIRDEVELSQEDIGLDVPEIPTNRFWSIILNIFLVIFIVIILIIFRLKKVKTKINMNNHYHTISDSIDEDELPTKVIQYIKKQEGRTTQKDIRKQFPFSEAKISLIVTELETKGKIQKIKKGRGNIILLKND